MPISQTITENSTQDSIKIEFMGLKFRLSLCAEQKKIVDQTLGNARYVYNFGLKQAQDYWARNKHLEKDKQEPFLSSKELSAQLTKLKKELWVIDQKKLQSLIENENIDWSTITGEQFNSLPRIYWLEHNCLSTALQQSLKHMDNARQRFFKGHSGFPQFKKKSHGSSCTITPNNMNFLFKEADKRNDYLSKAKSIQDKAFKHSIKISTHTLMKEKLSLNINDYDLILSKTSKPLKIHWDGRSFKASDIKSITLSKSASGKYYITFLVPLNNQNINQTVLSTHKQILQIGDTVGIDMGIKTTATLCSRISQYIQEKKIKGLASHNKRLARAQRSLSKKKKGSNNFHKARIKVAKVHEDLVNYRTNFYHELSTDILKQYNTAVMEDLNLKGMVKNKRLAKSISLQAWGMFFNMLMYKAKLYNKEIVVADRYFPSSKICSACDHYNRYYGQLEQPTNKKGKKNIQLPDMWQCSECGVKHQRDDNASKNLADYAELKDTYKDIIKMSVEKDLNKIYQITNGVNVNMNIKNHSTGELSETGLDKTSQMSTAELVRPKNNVKIVQRLNSKTKPKSLAHGETDTLSLN